MSAQVHVDDQHHAGQALVMIMVAVVMMLVMIVVPPMCHPIPACRIVAVTLPPALDNTFIVRRIAATGVLNVA